jgi:hypothetical protein
MNVGILDEQVLVLLLRVLNWHSNVLCVVEQVSRRLRAVAERVLWRELYVSRLPRMMSTLTGARAGVSRRWVAVAGEAAPLLLWQPGRHFAHDFAGGWSFLSRLCDGDLF